MREHRHRLAEAVLPVPETSPGPAAPSSAPRQRPRVAAGRSGTWRLLEPTRSVAHRHLCIEQGAGEGAPAARGRHGPRTARFALPGRQRMVTGDATASAGDGRSTSCRDRRAIHRRAGRRDGRAATVIDLTTGGRSADQRESDAACSDTDLWTSTTASFRRRSARTSPCSSFTGLVGRRDGRASYCRTASDRVGATCSTRGSQRARYRGQLAAGAHLPERVRNVSSNVHETHEGNKP